MRRNERAIRDRRRLSYSYAITAENHTPTEVTLTLHDQLPIARHEDIKVRPEWTGPEPTRETELNLLDWELTLAPGETQAVRFDFVVEHPRGMGVTGLP